MVDEADPKGNPIGTELVYEDDSVRVWRIELAPGETAGWHTHYLDYTTVVVEGDVVERPNADGSVDRIEVKPGAIMRWNQGTLRHALKTPLKKYRPGHFARLAAGSPSSVSRSTAVGAPCFFWALIATERPVAVSSRKPIIVS